MILKLTKKNSTTPNEPLIIDTTGIVLHPAHEGTCIITLSEYKLYVKETIEEITQQIKEGGIASEHHPTTS